MKQIILLVVAATIACAAACHSNVGTPGIQVSVEDGHLVYSDAIRFETDSDRLAAGSTEVLDAIAGFLGAHSGIGSVRVEGHTDAHGSADHNDDLSRRRAATVADYLRTHGVQQAITAHGFGATRPLCNETSADCDARNRRVEFLVTAE